MNMSIKNTAHAALAGCFAMLLSIGCGNNKVVDSDNTLPDFPVNTELAAIFIAKGLPPDIANFLAAAKQDTTRIDAHTFFYRQIFPNGATREITMKISPHQFYTPTIAESTLVALGGEPLYNFNYTSSTDANGTTRINLNYFVPTAALPAELAALKKSTAGGESEGAGVAWSEVGKTGADVGIGSLLDYAKDNGIPAGNLSNIYSLASAASAIGGAMELARQNGSWLLELTALEECARNPTNPITQSDPNYTPNAVDKINQARNELKEVNAARFLNQMNETGSGITPQTAVMSIGLKAGFVWSDKTLESYTQNTIMREVRLMVVPCGDPHVNLDGNVDVLWVCNDIGQYTSTTTTTHIVCTVGWIWDATWKRYFSRGSYTYERKQVSVGGGTTCTYLETAKGSLDQTGSLMVYTDPAAIALFGFDYQANGEIQTEADWTEDCQGTSGKAPVTITWLPNGISGLSGSSGAIAGERTGPSCVGSSASGTEVVKWEFTVPPAQ